MIEVPDIFSPNRFETNYATGYEARKRENQNIPVCYYIANNNTEDAIAFLRKRGYSVDRDVNKIAKAIKHVIQHGNDKDYEDLKKIHPDYDLFEEEKPKAEHFKNADAVNIEAMPLPPKNATAASQPEPVINVRTAYALIGAASAITILGLISWGVKNIKTQ